MLENLPSFAFHGLPKPAIAYQLLALPHFGTKTDISSVLDPSRQKDYLNGVLAIGIIAWTSFVLWTALLIALKWAGSEKVGFLSGAFRDVPRPLYGLAKDHAGSDTATDDASSDDCSSLEKPSSYEVGHDLSASLTNEFAASKKPMRKAGSLTVATCRLIFCGSGLIFLACLVLVFTQGLLHVQETVDVASAASSQVYDIVNETSTLVHKNVPSAKSLISSVRKGIQLELVRPDFCPADPAMDDTPLASEIRLYAYDVIGQLDTLDKYLSFDSKKISEILKLLSQVSGDVFERTDTMEVTGFLSALCFVILALLPVLLSGAAIMAQNQVSFPMLESMVRWVLAPIFVVVVVAAWTMMVVVLVSATMSADFCIPSGGVAGSGPDQTVLNMLQAVHEHPGSMAYQLAEHVISDCEVNSTVIDMLHDYQFKTVRRLADGS